MTQSKQSALYPFILSTKYHTYHSMYTKFPICLLLITIIQATQVTLVVDHPFPKADDRIEILVGVKAEAELLNDALDTASVRVEEVEQIIAKHCRNNHKSKQCEQISEQTGCEIEPLYRAVKGKPVFQAFEVNCEVVGVVKNPKTVGVLVDQLAAKPGVEIKSNLDEMQQKEANRQAIAEGLEQAKKRCKNLGMEFSKVLSIEEIVDLELWEQDYDDVEDEKQEIEGEEEEEDEYFVTFRLVVECQKTAKGKKNKKNK